MTLQEIANEAIKGAIAAVMTIVIMGLLTLIAWLTKRLKTSAQNMQNKKVPSSLPKNMDHFIVLTALIWMLHRTIALAEPNPTGWTVALIAGWTWAVLTYGLHIVRSK